MEKNKVSIIIPIYKVENYIQECLDSVLNQSYQNLEIILVDDGSPDKCPEICEEFGKKDKRIKVIHQKNQGLSGARNTGMKNASGDYILFLDSDDYISKNYCSQAVKMAEEMKSDIVVGEIITVDENGADIDSNLGLKISNKKMFNNIQAMEEVVIEQQLRGYAWGKLLKREIAENVTYPVGKAYEDRFTIYKYFAKANKVCLCPGAITYYRLRESSITHSKNLDKWYDLIEGEESLLNFCKKHYPDLVPLAEAKFIGRYVHIWINFYDSGDREKTKELVKKMKVVYKKYGHKSSIKKVHKISFLMIFAMPHLYRWLIHVTNYDKNER